MAERHAELPWKFSPWHIEEGPSAVRCATGYLVCETAGDADAKLIVKAVNSHAALVKALEECHSALAMMIEPETIQETSTLHAWSHTVAAERKARATLAAVGSAGMKP